MKVSVIIPFVNEWPQVAFTIRAVREELKNYFDYEIIAIDNYCKEVEDQKTVPDRGHDAFIINKQRKPFYSITDKEKQKASFTKGHIAAQAKNHSWLECVRYDKKLSHWNAKNEGVKHSNGDILIFLDSHVIPSRDSLYTALKVFDDHLNLKNGWMDTFHIPLSYQILESKRLIYKLIHEPKIGNVHYSFTTFMSKYGIDKVEVPCMSTCGMLMTRKMFDFLGGWPIAMGIYGGGENFINFTMAILGAKKYISNFGTLHHHGDRRGYSFNWTDYHLNRMIATAIFGGDEYLDKYQIALAGPSNNQTKGMAAKAWGVSKEHRNRLTHHKKINIKDWCKQWEK